MLLSDTPASCSSSQPHPHPLHIPPLLLPPPASQNQTHLTAQNPGAVKRPAPPMVKGVKKRMVQHAWRLLQSCHTHSLHRRCPVQASPQRRTWLSTTAHREVRTLCACALCCFTCLITGQCTRACGWRLFRLLQKLCFRLECEWLSFEWRGNRAVDDLSLNLHFLPAPSRNGLCATLPDKGMMLHCMQQACHECRGVLLFHLSIDFCILRCHWQTWADWCVCSC